MFFQFAPNIQTFLLNVQIFLVFDEKKIEFNFYTIFLLSKKYLFLIFECEFYLHFLKY